MSASFADWKGLRLSDGLFRGLGASSLGRLNPFTRCNQLWTARLFYGIGYGPGRSSFGGSTTAPLPGKTLSGKHALSQSLSRLREL